MQIYDISVPLGSETPVYEGDPPINIISKSSIAAGDLANVSLLNLGSHSGTHIDAPFHFNNNGKTVDQIPLHYFIGPAQVVELKSNELITLNELANQVHKDASRILLKTSNSRLWGNKGNQFVRDFVHLSTEAAEWIAEAGIKLVGIDYLSIERFHSPDHYVHHKLLDNNIVIIEGLNLSKITPGIYNLICLPLKIQGCDASPVRAILTN